MDSNMIYVQDKLEIIIRVAKIIILGLFTYYTNFVIKDQKTNFSLKACGKIFLIILIGVACAVIRYNINYLLSIIFMIIMVSFIFSTDNVINSITATTISFGINHIIAFVTFLIAFIFNKIFKINNDYINFIIITLFHGIILYGIFKRRKYKHGFAFLKKEKSNDYIDVCILSVSTIILFTIVMLIHADLALVKDIGVMLIIFSSIMCITIQKSLQLYYKQKLYEKELNETKAKLEDKEKEVKELEAENLKISKNSHTLSHKQKSLEYKIEQMMSKAEISTEEAAEVRDRVKEIEKDLYKEKSTIKLDKTGIAQIDDMLEYMQSECKKNKIDFELQIKGNIYYMTNNLISKEDLETLLADHIKNAIIAINHTDNVNRSILVRLGEIDGIYSLYIYDSGIEFEKETLENLGKKPSTTHANEGGTGMGFMNTFDTLRKCEASLIIHELNEPSKDNYTKAIIIKFDKKNEFQIISYR